MTASDPVEQARAWLEDKTGRPAPEALTPETGFAGPPGAEGLGGGTPPGSPRVGAPAGTSPGASRSGAWGASGSGLSSAESGRAAFVPHVTGGDSSDRDAGFDRTGKGGSGTGRSRKRRSSTRRSFGVGASDPADGPPEPDADPVGTARTIALRKLTASARTRHELDEALQKKNVPDEIVTAVLDRLEDVGLIDDGAFAQSWVESRQQRRHLSRSALRRELQTKGVDREQVDAALASVDVDDELAAARALAAKKVASMHGLDRVVRERRLAGVLARRGFGSGIVSTVLGELRDGHGA
jgi:regulatory protein